MLGHAETPPPCGFMTLAAIGSEPANGGPSESAAVSPLSSPSITRGVPLASYSRRRSSFSSMSMLGGPTVADWPPGTALSAMLAPANSAPLFDSPLGRTFRKMRGPGSGEPGAGGLPVGDVGLTQPRDGDAGRFGVVWIGAPW